MRFFSIVSPIASPILLPRFFLGCTLVILLAGCSRQLASAAPEGDAVNVASPELEELDEVDSLREFPEVSAVGDSESRSRLRPQVGPFAVPARLRGRVDFWKLVFAKYGKYQVIIHHREFPQVMFGVMDFTTEAQSMNPVELARFREQTEKQAVASIKTELLKLASGQSPSTSLQKRIVGSMSFLPGGLSKYQRLVDEDLVRTQTGIRERYAEAIRRSWRYLPVMEQIFVSEYGLPKELTRLPFIESSFDYTAYSSVGAAGMWQFMPRTAKAHKMIVGKLVDERRDPIKATRGAAEYLQAAYSSLKKWPLAVTSYNHGVGGVRSKVNKAGSDDIADLVESTSERYFGFASSNFYPEFLAAVEVFNEHEKYFPEIQIQPPLRVVSVRLKSPMSVRHVTSQIGISTEELQEANYALLDPIWEGRSKIPGGYILRVPVHYKERAEHLASGGREEAQHGAGIRQEAAVSASSVYGGVVYTVRRGDTISSIAKRYQTSPAAIKQLNPKLEKTVRVGDKIKVKASESEPVEVVREPRPTSQKSKKVSPQKPNKTPSKKHRVAKGESLSTIAMRYGVSVEQLKKGNGLKSSQVAAGRTLVIP